MALFLICREISMKEKLSFELPMTFWHFIRKINLIFIKKHSMLRNIGREIRQQRMFTDDVQVFANKFMDDRQANFVISVATCLLPRTECASTDRFDIRPDE